MKKMTLAALIAVLGMIASDAFAWGHGRCYRRGCERPVCDQPCARPVCDQPCARPSCEPCARPACPPKDCVTQCFPRCGGEVTSSYSESGQPCCIKRYVCERSFPANVHITTHKAYTCPDVCETYPQGYQAMTQWKEITGSGADLTGADQHNDQAY